MILYQYFGKNVSFLLLQVFKISLCLTPLVIKILIKFKLFKSMNVHMLY